MVLLRFGRGQPKREPSHAARGESFGNFGYCLLETYSRFCLEIAGWLKKGGVMSWDLIAFDFVEPQSAPEDGRAVFTDGWEPPTMGTPDQLRKIIAAIFPDVTWDDAGWGLVVAGDYSMEMTVGHKEQVASFSIYARGNATPAVLKMMEATGWQFLDIGLGKWIDPAADPDEGRRKFQEYLDLVKAQTGPQPPLRPRNWLAVLFAAIFRR